MTASDGPSFQNARLTLELGRLDIPFADAGLPSGNGGVRDKIVAPEIAPPPIEEAAEFPALQDIALTEIIRHAAFGRVNVRIPLVPFEKKMGPLRFVLPRGHTASISLEVKEGFIDRAGTHGTIEPPVDLPLGTRLEGLRLSKDGSVILRLKNFPDLNLSTLSLGNLHVPEALEDVLDLLKKKEPAPDEPLESSGAAEVSSQDEQREPGLDLRFIELDAQGIRPRPTALDLGPLGSVTLGKETLLDVTFRDGTLNIGGRLDLQGGALRGATWTIENLRGRGDFRMTVDRGAGERSGALMLETDVTDGAFDALELDLSDGTAISLGPSSVADATGRLSRDGKSPIQFQLSTPEIRGTLDRADIHLHVGGHRHRVQVDSSELVGSIALSEKHHRLDVRVSETKVVAEDVLLPLGIITLQLPRAEARGQGRIILGTDYGMSFTGVLDAKADVAAGVFSLMDVEAAIKSGTHGSFRLTELAMSEDGLDAVRGTGQLKFILGSGSLPLFEDTRLHFSRGAKGVLTVHSADLQAGEKFPSVKARAVVAAKADPIGFMQKITVPGGDAQIEANEIEITPAGRLVVDGLTMWLHSDDYASS